MASSLQSLTREQINFFIVWGLVIIALLSVILFVIPASSKADDPLVEESVFDLLFLTCFIGIRCVPIPKVPIPNGGQIIRMIKRYAALGIILVFANYVFVWYMLSSNNWLPMYAHINTAAFFGPIVLGSLHIYKYINPSASIK